MQIYKRLVQKGLIKIEALINNLVEEVKSKVSVLVEASGRHVHLSRDDADALFGKGHVFKIKKELSQPGQFACVERVDITGPKGTIKNVAILGPCRSKTQVEISMTDARQLGINAPVRLSGDVKNTPGCKITNGDKSIETNEGVIIARRHIHVTPQDAQKFNIKDNDILKIKVFANRPLIFDDICARISNDFSTAVHIDYDEANACGFSADTVGIIVK